MARLWVWYLYRGYIGEGLDHQPHGDLASIEQVLGTGDSVHGSTQVPGAAVTCKRNGSPSLIKLNIYTGCLYPLYRPTPYHRPEL